MGLAQLLQLTFFGGLALSLVGRGILPERQAKFIETNQMPILGVCFLCNMVSGNMLNTGAFEIKYNGAPVWSKMETGRFPQMDELREKYGKYQRERDGVGGGDVPHTDAALAQSQARMDADFRAREPAEISESSNTDDSAAAPGSRIKVCDVCRGMRVTHTEYNHRVMERMCERCEGEGVLQDGKPIVTPGTLVAEEAKEKQAKSTDAKVKEGMEKDHRLRRYAELFAVCELLEKKLDGYAQEIVDAQAKIADGNAKVELEEATAELVQQVTLHRATLRTRLDGYRAELEPLEAQLEKDGVFASIVDLETDVDELP